MLQLHLCIFVCMFASMLVSMEGLCFCGVCLQSWRALRGLVPLLSSMLVSKHVSRRVSVEVVCHSCVCATVPGTSLIPCFEPPWPCKTTNVTPQALSLHRVLASGALSTVLLLSVFIPSASSSFLHPYLLFTCCPLNSTWPISAAPPSCTAYPCPTGTLRRGPLACAIKLHCPA